MGADSPIEHIRAWPVVSLAEIAIKIGSGATPKGGAETYLPSRRRFALVRSQNVFDRRFGREGLAFITDEQADGLRGVVLQADDILLNITGDGVTFGRACLVPKDILPACVNQHVSIIRLDPRRATAGYVLAFLTHPDVKGYIESFNAGGSRRAVTKGHIESFRLPLPPLSEQRAIARILGTLDDKIDLNRCMNETLEAMAQAIFKDWFVDFGPTRAKMEGRAGYISPKIWKLFPDRLDDEGKPEGWITSTIGEEVDVVGGSTPSTGEPGYWNGDLAWTTPKDLSPLTTPILLSTERMITTAGLAQIGSGLLPVGTVLLSSRAPIGYIAVAKIPTAINQGFIGMICRKRISNVFVWLWARANLSTILQHANGSTFQEISKKNFRPLPCLLPSSEILKAFNEIASPLFDRIASSTHEDRWLMQTRDLLLPKLISGEIRVLNVEKTAEPAL